MRCYEEGVADMRSAYTLYKLLFLTHKTMAAMVELRKAALAVLQQACHTRSGALRRRSRHSSLDES